ncbi:MULTISPECIES: hypothetical protein [Thermococcus]|uniref:Uncharacterized protein n=2 Tax=Thermococcus sibiricus TaxID=172049 RepID=C6A2H7_THESM|nr:MULTISPECIES: hypothetical protein [Thermococcus]ACS89822.1 hypothetical protein TSIB_0761 [Thermococcus sibiricus MM 739]KUK18199.1 MAG: Uncharacterized protein XD54_0447 [Thermococcus sibiricus]MBC7095037.1 hypothetical protein [Thermococcus sp.]HII67436.1 hypothetical protein [Thermococcaceae archaeon]
MYAHTEFDEVTKMLARIVYYKNSTIPEEKIIAVNKIEKAIEIARKNLGRDTIGFEIEEI